MGTYHSSKIWSFHMLTGCCANALEIHTDPKACEYIVVKGGRRKVEEYTAEDAETQELRSRQGGCDSLRLSSLRFGRAVGCGLVNQSWLAGVASSMVFAGGDSQLNCVAVKVWLM